MGALLTTASTLHCQHGGTVSVDTTNERARAGGALLVGAGDTFTIRGCGLNRPCALVLWTPGAESTITGDFTLNEHSVGMCLAADSSPQGTVMIDVTQQQVKGR